MRNSSVIHSSKLLVALLAKGVPFQLIDLPCDGTSRYVDEALQLVDGLWQPGLWPHPACSADYRSRVPLGKIPALIVQEQGEEVCVTRPFPRHVLNCKSVQLADQLNVMCIQEQLLMESEIIIEWSVESSHRSCHQVLLVHADA
jgi:hypothetical protein